ncbi:MAG: hypothetical protein JXR61_07925 [Prolixibacteraceae bacterium]|nr:hypothetical protein [Prolixibacteraceae bacterium]
MAEKNNFNVNRKLNFTDPGFIEIANAISMLNKGKEISVVINKPLFRDDFFQVTKTFPRSIANVNRSYKLLKEWKTLFSIAPQLVIPQKVIYAGTKKTWHSNFADFWYKNSDQKRSAYIDSILPENLRFLNFEKLQGVVFQEYKINVSRIYIELLKVFENAGGKLINYTVENIKSEANMAGKKVSHFKTTISCPENFNLCIHKDKTEILFSETDGKLTATITGENFNAGIFLNYLNNESIAYQEFQLPILLTKNAVKEITGTVQNPLFCSFKNTEIESNYELCLEKFDIAKQTGIDFTSFRKLFYRYGKHIETVTDLAYENMIWQRDPKILWKNAEIEFRKKYEWGS